MVTELHRVAWMGGSRPPKYRESGPEFRALTRRFFREDMAEMRKYWGDFQGLSESVLWSARGVWRAAKYDAHATLRDRDRSKPLKVLFRIWMGHDNHGH